MQLDMIFLARGTDVFRAQAKYTSVWSGIARVALLWGFKMHHPFVLVFVSYILEFAYKVMDKVFNTRYIVRRDNDKKSSLVHIIEHHLWLWSY